MHLKVAYQWMYRYKLYHLPFWFIYHILLWTIMIGDPVAVFHHLNGSPYALKFLFYVVFQALGVYFNLYYLIPRFLEKGRYALYISLVLFTIIATAALIVPGYFISGWLSGRSVDELYQVQRADFWYFFQVNTLPSSAASMTLAMSVKLTKNWLEARSRARLLEKEKMETELKFLKSQFNPHFLFNTINSIFVLIHKNPDKASASLAKFSDLLRYQLYECNEQQILLAQELRYLENFIELERLRQEKDLLVSVELPDSETANLSIAPFLLMPFVENAFKHVSRTRHTSNHVSIRATISGDRFLLDVRNSISQQTVSDSGIVKYGGIGLRNVKRRLDLLYPGQYTMEAKEDQHEYRIQLKLPLQRQGVITINELSMT